MADNINVITIEGRSGSGRTEAAMAIALSPLHEGANVLWLYPTQSHASDALRRYRLRQSRIYPTEALTRGMQFVSSESVLGSDTFAHDSLKLVIVDDCELHRPGVIQQLLSEMSNQPGGEGKSVILIRNSFKW